MRSEPPSSRAFWVLTALGLGVVVFGLVGLLVNAGATRPFEWARDLVLFLFGHDGVLVWLVIGAGAALSRLLPDPVRPTVQGALVVSAALTLIAVPVLGGFGRLSTNASLLPDRSYWDNLGIVLAVVWGPTAALLAARGVRHRRARRARLQGRHRHHD